MESVEKIGCCELVCIGLSKMLGPRDTYTLLIAQDALEMFPGRAICQRYEL